MKSPTSGIKTESDLIEVQTLLYSKKCAVIIFYDEKIQNIKLNSDDTSLLIFKLKFSHKIEKIVRSPSA